MTAIVAPLTALNLVNVLDRGVPNKERIAISANEFVSLGEYGLMIGVGNSLGSAAPIKDNMLWFGDGYLTKGDWLFVYTGPGTPRRDPFANGNSIVSAYWGKDHTVFYSPDLVPILFRVGEVAVLPTVQPQPLPQTMTGPISKIADAAGRKNS